MFVKRPKTTHQSITFIYVFKGTVLKRSQEETRLLCSICFLWAGNRLKFQWYTYWYPAVLALTGGFLVGRRTRGFARFFSRILRASTVGTLIFSHGFFINSSFWTHYRYPQMIVNFLKIWEDVLFQNLLPVHTLRSQLTVGKVQKTPLWYTQKPQKSKSL